MTGLLPSQTLFCYYEVDSGEEGPYQNHIAVNPERVRKLWCRDRTATARWGDKTTRAISNRQNCRPGKSKIDGRGIWNGGQPRE